MANPQPGILALGTGSQLYLEFDRRPGAAASDVASAVAGLREPRTTGAGVNLVAGFRPELWREIAPADAPADVTGFNRPIVGVEGFSMPATQHDIVLWFSGGAFDVVFDEGRAAIGALAQVATIASDTPGWPYHLDRDLTGFIDGTENPTLPEAPDVAIVPDGRPGAGGSVLLLQKWEHDAANWEALPVGDQERAMGRTKPDSVEFDPKPTNSHAGKTDQDVFGKVFRRNIPYGTSTVHGTLFVGFCKEQAPLQRMLESMAGTTDGIRDALTRYTRPLTGAYYFVPSSDALRRISPSLDS